MKYHRIKNTIFQSNTYVLENGSGQIIVIDPGEQHSENLLSLIGIKKWSLEGVILTHEHVDHIAGLPSLLELKKVPVFCSKLASFNVGDRKYNLSKYITGIDDFELNIDTTIPCDNKNFELEGFNFFFMQTPGHSPGSACIFMPNAFFSGDTILNDQKVPLNLPGSSKLDYFRSLVKIKSKLRPGVTVYPGHGDPFKYELGMFEI